MVIVKTTLNSRSSLYNSDPTFPRDIIFTKTEDELVIQWTPPRGFANYIAIESPEGIFEVGKVTFGLFSSLNSLPNCFCCHGKAVITYQ